MQPLIFTDFPILHPFPITEAYTIDDSPIIVSSPTHELLPTIAP